ncbi:hypothetical protein HK099_003300, partial [Clydaea vesicula]
MTHLPTGITVFSQNERSQHQNKAVALKIIKARIYDKELKKRAAEKVEVRSELPDNSWGNQIRTYVLTPYQLAKDLRTGYERKDVDNILN